MLELKKIVKDYKVADTYVHALKGIDLNFRDNEFVSILGPSGCGKTTTLNIVGGLDQYTDGDLIINGVSTKTFKDRDWDVYRNHRIGFIFQSYNLIPHQNILSNVELSLTIAGVSKEERTSRAKEALDRVGLKDQYYKKPNQLSGGQCQRVAIARALVNNPDILLADEPTGALDTVTSVQIMDLIKEISAEKLVIMVTHNPDLAEKYSTRIVKLLDGEVLEDSNPYNPTEEELKAIYASYNNENANEASVQVEASETGNKTDDNKEIAEAKENKPEIQVIDKKNRKEKEKAKMSLWTAIKLSAKNLYSKFKRTTMVVIAGSIGIIGVSTVLSVSQGVRDYIDGIQDDLLSGNPITIKENSIDLETITNLMSLQNNVDYVKKGDYVGVDSLLQYVALNQNLFQDIVANTEGFSDDYLRYVKSMPEDYYAAISFNYGIDFNASIYTKYRVSNGNEGLDGDGAKVFDKNDANTLKEQNISLDTIKKQYLGMLANNDEAKDFASTLSGLSDGIGLCINDNDYIKTQYNVIAGDLPKNPEDILVVVDSKRREEDLTLGQLGYFSQNEAQVLIYDASAKFYEKESKNDEKTKAQRESALEKSNQYKKIVNDNPYLLKKKFEYDELLNKEFEWFPNDLIYSDIDLDNPDEKTIKYNNSRNSDWEAVSVSDAIKANGTKGIKLNVCGIVERKKNVSYGSLNSGFLYSEDLARAVIKINQNSNIANVIRSNKLHTDSLRYDFTYWNCNLNKAKGEVYSLEELHAKEVNVRLNTDSSVQEEDIDDYVTLELSGGSSMSSVISGMMSNYGFGKKDGFNLNSVGASFHPTTIKVYPNSFDDKDLVTDYLDDWNNNKKTVKVYAWDIETFDKQVEGYKYEDPIDDTIKTSVDSENKFDIDSDGYYTLTGADRTDIKYNDSAELIVNIINSVINIITYALVAFTALSLVVSTVMVGIITYVSVVERTNEIGVIRSLGGRKKDVSHLFNAESIIIGLASGIFGVLVTGIISLIANIIVTQVSDGTITMIARMTPGNIISMITISVLLTAISGIIPARAAARKDPVDALRTI